MTPLTSDSSLIVYVDVKSPYAFVAIGPILALEKEVEQRFDWRPLTLNIPSYLGSAEKKDGKVTQSEGRSAQLWRAIKYSYGDARRYAERQGLILKGTEKIWDSSLANIGILWVSQEAREQLPDYLRGVFHPFWRRELDIEDRTVIEGCMLEAGVPIEGFAEFASGKGRKLHDDLQPQFHDHGIFGVPTFVINGETLFGREHIPRVRWHLTGQPGPSPDIAYEI